MKATLDVLEELAESIVMTIFLTTFALGTPYLLHKLLTRLFDLMGVLK